jgi:hypothetical protein
MAAVATVCRLATERCVPARPDLAMVIAARRGKVARRERGLRPADRAVEHAAGASRASPDDPHNLL